MTVGRDVGRGAVGFVATVGDALGAELALATELALADGAGAVVLAEGSGVALVATAVVGAAGCDVGGDVGATDSVVAGEADAPEGDFFPSTPPLA